MYIYTMKERDYSTYVDKPWSMGIIDVTKCEELILARGKKRGPSCAEFIDDMLNNLRGWMK